MNFLRTLVAVAFCLAAQSASAQYSPQAEASSREVAGNPIAKPGSFRIDIQGYLSGAGRAAFLIDGEERANEDMRATIGLQVQGLVPIGDYLLVGPAFSLRSFCWEGASHRLNVYGFDVAFGAHYGVQLSDSIAIDPYALFTLGLAVADAEQGVLSEDTEFGVGLGVRLGATLWFDHAFGVRFGLGHQSTRFRPESVILENTLVRFRELALEAGISIRLGN